MNKFTKKQIKKHGEKINGRWVIWDGCMATPTFVTVNLKTVRKTVI
jgi:hypothetical protein